MTAGEIAGLCAFAALIGAAAVLSATETVLLRLSLVRALRLAEEDEPGGDRLVWLLEHRASALNAVLVLTVTARVTAATIAVFLASSWTASVPAGVASAVVVTGLSLVAGEVAPRTYALRHLERFGLRVAGLAGVLTRALMPVAHVVIALSRWPWRGAEVSGPYPSDDELRELLVAEDEDEPLEEEERAMIRSIFELGDTIAREIMVPRPDMITIARDAPLRELVNTVVEEGYSRIPVHGDSRDEITGVVYAKDVMKRLAMQPGRSNWHDLIRPPTFMPETKRVDELLRELQAQQVHLAVVVDEYGALAGLVTIEDILEEIVGEIVDEHDREEPLVEILNDVQMRVDARLGVDDLNELLESDLPSEGWDTVGGLLLGMLGHVPSPGEHVELDGMTLTAERVQGRRISKVLVVRPADVVIEEEGAST